MSNRRRIRTHAGRRPVPPRGPAFDALADEIVNLMIFCRVGQCSRQATAWFPRVDVTDARLVVYPTCVEHEQVGRDASCDDASCCQPEGHVALRHEDAVIDQLLAAIYADFGVGVPMRHDVRQLDVVRPMFAGRRS